METIIGYKYEIWYDGSLIHVDDDMYDTEEEAKKDAYEYMHDKQKQWEADGSWHEDDDMKLFSVEIIDVTEDVENNAV